MWVRPTRGRRILTRYRAMLYVGDLLDATIRGKSGLWIFRLSEEHGAG